MQTTRTYNPNRKEHVWHWKKTHGRYKCVLCGAITKRPIQVDLGELMPDRYEPLTNQERALCPFVKAA